MNDTLFRILATLIMVVTLAVGGYHRRRADRLTGEKISIAAEGLLIAIPLRLIGLSLWFSVFGYLINPAWMAWSHVDLPEWARWLGIGMGVAAAFLVYWVFSSLGTNVTPTVVTRSAHTLVTAGPYRWVRHPLYSTGLISFLGFALIAENWWIALMAVMTFLILAIRTRQEEANLIARFGDEYRAYMRRTGRYLPNV